MTFQQLARRLRQIAEWMENTGPKALSVDQAVKTLERLADRIEKQARVGGE